MSQYRTAPVPHEGYPPGIPYIVGNEAAERFSFYGMKVLLTFYFMRVLMFSELDSARYVHYFITAAYLMPLLGGFLADRFLGKYDTIIWLSLVYCLGHLVLSLTEGQAWGAFAGLALIAVGAGGIKPCVSAHVGDQFAMGEEAKLQKVFSLFYFVINFGAGFSTILMPWVRDHWGYRWAFGIPGILMGVATLVFWMGRHKFVHVPPTGPNPNSFFRVVWHAIRNFGRRPAGGSWLDAANDRFAPDVITGVKAVFSILGVFAFVVVFWMLQDQMSTTWTIQAARMDLRIIEPGSWFKEGLTIAPDQMQSLNPFLVMLLVPLMTFVVYPGVGRLGFEMTPLRRMTVGMLCSFVSFVMAGVLQVLIDRGQTVNVLWQAPGYIVLTLAEVLVSITGLEFAYTQSPRSMKSAVMSFWLVTVAIANFLIPHFLTVSNWIGGELTKLGVEGLTIEPGKVTAANFFMFSGLMFLAGFAFAWRAYLYRPVNFMEPATPDDADQPL